MNDIRKKKLMEYLYPTSEIQEFMIYDFFVELSFSLSKDICFSNKNKQVTVRVENLEKSKNIIKNFISSNLIYKKRLKELYRCEIEDSFINEILWGYILFITSDINCGTGADVFWDKRSVCYNCVSILDIN